MDDINTLIHRLEVTVDDTGTVLNRINAFLTQEKLDAEKRRSVLEKTILDTKASMDEVQRAIQNL